MSSNAHKPIHPSASVGETIGHSIMPHSGKEHSMSSNNRQKRLTNAGRMGLYRLVTMAKLIDHGKPEEIAEAEAWLLSYLKVNYPGDTDKATDLKNKRQQIVQQMTQTTDTEKITVLADELNKVNAAIAEAKIYPWS